MVPSSLSLPPSFSHSLILLFPLLLTPSGSIVSFTSLSPSGSLVSSISLPLVSSFPFSLNLLGPSFPFSISWVPRFLSLTQSLFLSLSLVPSFPLPPSGSLVSFLSLNPSFSHSLCFSFSLVPLFPLLLFSLWFPRLLSLAPSGSLVSFTSHFSSLWFLLLFFPLCACNSFSLFPHLHLAPPPQARGVALAKQLCDLEEQAEQTHVELQTFRRLQELEQLAIPSRLEVSFGGEGEGRGRVGEGRGKEGGGSWLFLQQLRTQSPLRHSSLGTG